MCILPNEAFITFEEFIQESLGSLDPGRSYSIAGLLLSLGQAGSTAGSLPRLQERGCRYTALPWQTR